MAYQPPLFYVISAALLNVTQTVHFEELRFKVIQALNVFVALGLVLLTWWASRLQGASGRVLFIILLGAAFSPALVFITPRVTNEVFTAAIIALGIVLAMRLLVRQELRMRDVIGVGIVAALALLSKFTAIFLVAAIGLGLILRLWTKRDRRALSHLGCFVLVITVLSGWYYLINVLSYGTLFPGVGRATGAQPFVQLPTFRFLEFYLSFGSAFFHDIEEARWISFWDGMFASFWSDGGMLFFADWMTQARALMSVTLLLAVLPTAAVVRGFLEICHDALIRPAVSLSDQFMLSVTVWSWCGLIYFTMQTASYTTMKAYYILSLMPVFGVMFYRGRQAMTLRVPWIGWAIDLSLVLLTLITVFIYRYGVYRA